MIRNLELFVERMIEAGIGEEEDSSIFKERLNVSLGKIAEISDKLEKTLDGKQLKLLNELDTYMSEYESVIERLYFYRGYKLACSFMEKR